MIRRTTHFIDDETYVDAFVGYRSWAVFTRDGKPFITSRFIGFFSPTSAPIWPHHLPLEARCHCSEPTAPAEYHECGIYANIEIDEDYFLFSWTVYGEVLLWGNVDIHEFGYRGEFARPSAFYTDLGCTLPQDVLESLALHYEVPLVRSRHVALAR